MTDIRFRRSKSARAGVQHCVRDIFLQAAIPSKARNLAFEPADRARFLVATAPRNDNLGSRPEPNVMLSDRTRNLTLATASAQKFSQCAFQHLGTEALDGELQRTSPVPRLAPGYRP